MNSFFKYAVYRNRYLWFHILAGGFLAKLLFGLWGSEQKVLMFIFFLAVAWEVLEFLTTNVRVVYGSSRRFFLDAVGDVLGAIFMATITLW